ncbi:MAG: phosphomethylpyrimidine synthase ThiC [Chloroflexi bacterium]|nr:phosphomethylpyrimidine synthase ThiC [Chloroflexota bacterium]MCL5075592.1 phosphomethylpyrimidine synthase ThiC [Chloroflexota bacterium]
MTQIEMARRGEITAATRMVAEDEGVAVEVIQQGMAEGMIVIPCNVNHKGLLPLGIGKGLRTKINANIGTSSDYPEMEPELEKVRAAAEAGADTVMDLSTGGDIDATRRGVLGLFNKPVGTVPIYQAAIEAINDQGTIVAMTVDGLFDTIERQARDGVDFITVHCGVTQETIRRLKSEGRVADIVSRGGAFLVGWMLYHERENPLFEEYDRLLEIAYRYDVTLSLGDGLRPGCLADATDRAQTQELIILGELVERARKANVQAMVEGPGHVPLDQIAANVQLQKRICKGAPFYVLGPLVTDVAPGYDHITAAIGGAIAAASGADFLCYVTPAEHLGLPNVDDVREGVIAARIAAHAADIVKGVRGASDWDLQMSRARKALDWERQIALAIDPVRPRHLREMHRLHDQEVCSMCGQFCAMKLVSATLGVEKIRC